MNWTPQQVAAMSRNDLYENLTKASEQWHRNGKMDAVVDKGLAEHSDADTEALAAWAQERFGQRVEAAELANLDAEGRKDLLIEKGRAMLRTELTQLERFVLLQILDTAWKDHLYAMDQLKDSVGLRGYAERDPRIEYKREGANQFNQMQATVRDRVTDLIFRAKLTPNVEQRSVYGQQRAEHDAAGSLLQGASAAASQGSADQQADMQAAQRAGAEDADRQMSRRQRRAAAARKDGGRDRETPSPSAMKGPRRKPRKKRRR
jgi:preprotein translocase subunit SecA